MKTAQTSSDKNFFLAYAVAGKVQKAMLDELNETHCRNISAAHNVALAIEDAVLLLLEKMDA